MERFRAAVVMLRDTGNAGWGVIDTETLTVAGQATFAMAVRGGVFATAATAEDYAALYNLDPTAHRGHQELARVLFLDEEGA